MVVSDSSVTLGSKEIFTEMASVPCVIQTFKESKLYACMPFFIILIRSDYLAAISNDVCLI
jgi:hypothetical protein